MEKLGAVLLCGQDVHRAVGLSRLLSQLNHVTFAKAFRVGLGQDPAITCYVYQGLQGKVGLGQDPAGVLDKF